jgi:nicotinate-nucleotide adenylyltransferase
MGGTFDPPHNGHFSIAAQVATKKQLDRVIFIPASQPWQKAGYSQADDRLAMTELGAACDERFTVSRIELDRTGPTYTVDTIAELSEQLPGAELFLILGADAVLNLETWHRVDVLARSTKVLAVTRPGFDLTRLERDRKGPPIEVVEVDPVDVSSTQVRAAVRDGRSISELVPPEIAAYIAAHDLYRDLPEPL